MEERLASTGVPGLDEVLRGGLPRDYIYLVQGDPGAGKTTLSLQFLREGAMKGERCLYLTLSETRKELERVAESHGWSLDGIEIFEHLVGEEILRREQDTTLFHPSEIELGKTVDALLKKVEELAPHRVVLDSLSEIRLLSQNALRYRKQVLALKQFFGNRNITTILIDDRTSDVNDVQLHSVPHGVIVLERAAPVYGAARRRLEVVKLRGRSYRGGYHDFDILRGGMVVYPRLVAADHDRKGGEGSIPSGVKGIDALMGGGLHLGSSTVILGPAGVGKSSLAAQYVLSAAEEGMRAVVFAFDESRSTLLARARSLGIDLDRGIEAGRVVVQQVDPAELSPGEFANLVRVEVEERGAKLIVIDSLNGYMNAMPEEGYLTLHLHELLTYLTEQGVASLMVVAQHGLLGSSGGATIDVSYLADAVILLRYFEAAAKVNKAISVLKKRSGPHERSIREFHMDDEGIHVGKPLAQFRGILSGVPILEPVALSGRAETGGAEEI